ncbi:hypothetical protein BpHYR1_029120 [Brachionus plicatilis]|uniref:Uncharacterized protein n=1 Tax=Brachionus plicatilis TaxID=10195 RepID=A0A3M7PPJ5_BRAPC|nr:hypothetical protein BpHYR1_029120 [Brachionus plicatilis]
MKESFPLLIKIFYIIKAPVYFHRTPYLRSLKHHLKIILISSTGPGQKFSDCVRSSKFRSEFNLRLFSALSESANSKESSLKLRDDSVSSVSKDCKAFVEAAAKFHTVKTWLGWIQANNEK